MATQFFIVHGVIPAWGACGELKQSQRMNMLPTDTETVSINGSPVIQSETRVKGLIYNRMARAREEVRELDGRGALVDDEATHGPSAGGARARRRDGLARVFSCSLCK